MEHNQQVTTITTDHTLSRVGDDQVMVRQPGYPDRIYSIGEIIDEARIARPDRYAVLLRAYEFLLYRKR